MNQDEASRVMTGVALLWPKTRWSEDVENRWLFDLTGIEPDIAIDAMEALHDNQDWAPTWHQFLDQANALRRAKKIRADEQKALQAAASPDEKQRASNLKGFRAFREKTKAEWPHLPILQQGRGVTIDLALARGARGHRGHKGGANLSDTQRAEDCPVCSKHDHTNKTTIGFAVDVSFRDAGPERRRIEHRDPIPAWHVTCPRCGTRTGLDVVCDTWTVDGLNLLRELGLRTESVGV